MLTGASGALTTRAALDLLEDYDAILLAVSGGPDSVALMLLAAQWAGRAQRRIEVATVDHGLRANSGAEARIVGDWARALGFVHHHLVWAGEKPSSRVQERARDARYSLLVDCAAAIGAQAIVTAHHADDQAETILFRLSRGTGVAGLSGMAAVAPCGPVALARPFLEASKADLAQICRQAGHPFLSDPSNTHEKFARARIRRLAPVLAEQGLDRESLMRLGRRARRASAALEFYTQSTMRSARIDSDDDCARFHAAKMLMAPAEIVLRALEKEIARLAPAARIRLDRLERLGESLASALAEGRTWRATLAGVLIETRKNELILRRAPPRQSRDAAPDRTDGRPSGD